jgi:phosphatidylserine decarboxylase
MSLIDCIKTLPQYMLPQHTLSKMIRYLSYSENPVLKSRLINLAIKHYGVNMSEALESNPDAYQHFNQFFTRQLKPEVRPLTTESKAIACPADGVISQCGNINQVNALQAKGKSFSIVDLLGGSVERAVPFMDGRFATIYLSPKDYHRLHMPLTGTLTEMVHVPGRLFSVNAATARSVPRLFARNERVVTIFDTEAGPMALVLVGAIFVCSIETVWHGIVTPPTTKTTQTWQYPQRRVTLEKGKEMGRFNMGSTIIVLFGKDKAEWLNDLKEGSCVKLGAKIGTLNQV